MSHSVSHIGVWLFAVVSGVDPRSIFLRKVLDPDVSSSDEWVLPRGTSCTACSRPPAVPHHSNMEAFIPHARFPHWKWSVKSCLRKRACC